MNDVVFLQRLKSGERQAFNELVMLYKNSVINTCYRFLLNQNDAEDVSQEVFITIFESINSFKGDSKLSTWIYRIAVTKSLDEIKKKNRKKRISSLGKILRLDDIVHWISGGKQPDADLELSEKMNQIQQSLQKLPQKQRIAFTLSKVDGFDNTEISAILKTTTVAVESLIYRAKKTISNDLLIIFKK